MTDFRAPHADRAAPSNGDAYFSRLPDEDRATFAGMTGEIDLSDDIRLIRTVIASLLVNLRDNYRHFGVLFGALARAVGLQIKTHSRADDVEDAILQAADDVLRLRSSPDGADAAAGPDEQP